MSCPLSFFFNKILGIRELVKDSDWISGIDRGNIVHEILDKLYKDVIIPSKNDIKTREYYIDQLDEIINDVFNEKIENSEIPYPEIVKQIVYKSEFKSIVKFIINDYEEWNDFFPCLTEWGFGIRADEEYYKRNLNIMIKYYL